MYERRTLDALHVAARIADTIPAEYVPQSPDAYLRLRFDYDRSRLLGRSDDPEDHREARRLLEQIFQNIRFENDNPLLIGERRFSLLNELSGTLGVVFGDHVRSVAVAYGLLRRAEEAGNESRIQIALGNLGDRLRRYGYAEACAGRADSARRHYEEAEERLRETLANEAQHLRHVDEDTRHESQLVRKSNLLLLRLEQLVLDDDPDQLAKKMNELERLRRDAEDIVRESRLNPIVAPVDFFARYARLGVVLVEIARAGDVAGRTAAGGQAMVARAFLQPFQEIYKVDGDIRPELAIRYADACRLSGDIRGARETLSLALHRLQARCGAEYGPCARIRARLALFE